MSQAILELIVAIVSGIPRLVQAVKDGRDPSQIKLGEFVSTDALEKVRAATARADDFIENG